jgi:isoamylase
MISEDPALRNTKLIAEAWDCDGLFQASDPASVSHAQAAIAADSLSAPQVMISRYMLSVDGSLTYAVDWQVGAFPHYGGRWAEWNGTFRDTVRQFVKGTEGPFASSFASAVCGSPSIYAAEQPGEGKKSYQCIQSPYL